MDQSAEQLNHVDAVMIGRAAYSNPYEFVTADQRFFNDHHPVLSRMEVFESMLPYIEAQLAQGKRLMTLTRHMLRLFAHARGAKHFKRVIGTAARKGPIRSDPAARADSGSNVPASGSNAIRKLIPQCHHHRNDHDSNAVQNQTLTEHGSHRNLS